MSYKLYIVTRVEASGMGDSVSVRSDVVEFATERDADRAYNSIDNAHIPQYTKITAVKLY